MIHQHDIQFIHSEQAPQAVGPYSQAVTYGDTIYASGQIGLVAETGKMVGESVEAQALQVMKNLSSVLKAAGSSERYILKASIFLVDMNDFPLVNKLYAEWLGDHRPARATVCVAALPLAARIEIDVIAMKMP